MARRLRGLAKADLAEPTSPRLSLADLETEARAELLALGITAEMLAESADKAWDF